MRNILYTKLQIKQGNVDSTHFQIKVTLHTINNKTG